MQDEISRNSCEPVLRALIRGEKIMADNRLIGYKPDELELIFNFALKGKFCSNITNFSEKLFCAKKFVFLLDFLRRQRGPNDLVRLLKAPMGNIIKALPENSLKLSTEAQKYPAWYYAVSIWRKDLLFISNDNIIQALVREETKVQLAVINHLYILELTNTAIVIGSLIFIEFRRKSAPFVDICKFYGAGICCSALAEKLRTEFNL